MNDGTRVSWKRREIERRLLEQVALARADFAARLRQLRENHDPPMTQEQAAAFIGVPARSYVRWENEEVDAFLSSREKIAKAYKIDPAELISEPGQPARLTPDDLARVEAKLDRVLAFIDQLATASGETPAKPPVAELARRAALRLDGTPAASAESDAAPDAADRAR